MGNQSPLIKLPNEILMNILENITSVDDYGRITYTSLWPLALTCKHLQRLSQPILWSQVTLRPDDEEEFPGAYFPEREEKSKLQSRKLRKCLDIKPDARLFCKRLSLFGWTEIGFSEVISTMKRFPNVKTLDLGCVATVEGHSDTRQVKEADEDALPLPDEIGSASFTQLNMSNYYRGTRKALQNFLQWPKALEVFTIDSLAMEGYDWPYLLTIINIQRWSYQQVVDVLSRHKATLEELHIGEIGPERWGSLDLSGFNALRTLAICYAGRPTPQVACDSWVIPSLEKLVLECSANDSQNGVIPDIPEGTDQWLKEFAHLVLAKRQAGNTNLTELEVVCDEVGDWAGRQEHLEAYRGPVESDGQSLLQTQQYVNELGLRMILR
ncbi:hypothetical protein BX600DRAFT_434674 [Xylariales sp. PMI_506]|nr:hypothetical protein BX600DRAFT_434674 [Xylariales sp. PMI_506]